MSPRKCKQRAKPMLVDQNTNEYTFATLQPMLPPVLFVPKSEPIDTYSELSSAPVTEGSLPIPILESREEYVPPPADKLSLPIDNVRVLPLRKRGRPKGSKTVRKTPKTEQGQEGSSNELKPRDINFKDTKEPKKRKKDERFMIELQKEKKVIHGVVLPAVVFPKFSEDDDLKCLWKNCNFECKGPTNLGAHVNSEHAKRVQGEELECQWEGCEYKDAFKYTVNLRIHLRTHTREKPYACEYPGCTSAYSRIVRLRQHFRTHVGDRPYACEFEGCGRAFFTAGDRNKHHGRIHTGASRSPCLVFNCTKVYTDQASLRKHLLAQHGVQSYELHRIAKRLNSTGTTRYMIFIPPDPEEEMRLETEDWLEHKGYLTLR